MDGIGEGQRSDGKPCMRAEVSKTDLLANQKKVAMLLAYRCLRAFKAHNSAAWERHFRPDTGR